MYDFILLCLVCLVYCLTYIRCDVMVISLHFYALLACSCFALSFYRFSHSCFFFTLSSTPILLLSSLSLPPYLSYSLLFFPSFQSLLSTSHSPPPPVRLNKKIKLETRLYDADTQNKQERHKYNRKKKKKKKKVLE